MFWILITFLITKISDEESFPPPLPTPPQPPAPAEGELEETICKEGIRESHS